MRGWITGVAALVVALPGATAAAAQHGHQGTGPGEEVRYASDEVELAGLLYLPEGEAPYPAAVMVRGSGETPRDNPWTLMIVDRLLEAGLAVLVPDKRGQGGSGGDWRVASMADRAADALAGVRYVRSRPEIGDRIGLVGLSQGGRVVPLAATRSSAVSFVVNVSGSAVPFEEQSNHEMANLTRQAGFGEEAIAGVLRLNRLAGAYLRTGAWEPYRRERASQLAEPWGRIIAGFPAEEDAAVWSFYRRVIDYDPIPYWERVAIPALVVYGAADERDNVPVRRSVERLERAFAESGNEDATVLVIPGVGHGLLAHGDRGRHGLHSAFVAALGDWLSGHARSPREAGPQ